MKSIVQFMSGCPRHFINQMLQLPSLQNFATGWSICSLTQCLIGVICFDIQWIQFLRLPSREPPVNLLTCPTVEPAVSSMVFRTSSLDKRPIYVELLPCCVMITPGLITRTTNSYSCAFHACLCWFAASTMTCKLNCPILPGASNSCGS